MLKGSLYKLIILVLLLIASVAMTTFGFVTDRLILSWSMLPFVGVALMGLIRLHSSNIHKITFMFNAIENGDYAFKFTEYDGLVNDNLLNLSLNRIKEILVKAKTEAIEREKYYEVILNSVNTGVIVINDAGNIYQINEEALRLFGLPYLNHINRLGVIDETLPSLFRTLKAGDKRQTSFSNERGTVHLAISTSAMRVRDMQLRIMALNDINNELDEKETESWIRLIRVLTHEIMNSITPITSLSDTLLQLKDEVSQEVREGLEVINSTSGSLIDFVESYRSVTRIPEPRFRSFDLRQLLERMVTLVRHDGAGSNCTIEIEVTPDDLLLYADETLIGQVILNLLKNATHAVAACETGIIRMVAFSSDTGEITIDITDNGTGISPEVAANIFVPFFTTKQSGSGIGLSISRQIMRLHNGNITLKNAQPGSTIFRLHFS